MLRKLKIITLTSIFAFTLFGGAACNRDAHNGDETAKPEKVTVGTVDGKTLMNGFEMFDRDVQLIRMFNEFGRVEQNSDKKYVRSGEKSLKLTPLGSRMATANPYILLPSFSTRFEEVAFGDFSNVDALSLWFYNAEEERVNVGIGFGTGAIKIDSSLRRDYMQKTNVEYFSLDTGWNYIEYKVEPAYLALQGLKIKEVYGVVIEMDYVESHKLVDAPEVYCDDVCLTYTDTPKTTGFTMDVETGMTSDGNQYWSLGDFEDPLESYYYSYYYKFPAPVSAHPIIKTVFAGDYGIMAKSGTRGLLIQKKHGGAYYGWPTVRIHETVVKAIFAAIGEDIVNNPQNYAFKFDLYNASAYTGGWSVEYENAQTFGSISVKPGEWGAYSYTVSAINAKMQTKEDGTKYDDFSKVGGAIEFRWSRYNTEADISDRPFILDNVRIEKIA